MKRFAFVFCIAICLVFLMSISSVFAEKIETQWWPGESPTPSSSGSLSGLVTAITSNTLTVQTENNGSPVFTINCDSKVTGKKTSLGDLKTGDKVIVSYTTLQNDNVWATTINLPGDTEPGKNYGSVFGKVSVVGPTSISVIAEDNSQKVFALTSKTGVKIKGEKSTIDQVKIGDPAIIAFAQTENGPVATSIRVLVEGIWPKLFGNVSGVVGALDASNITVQIEKNGDQTFGITEKTRFSVYGQKTTIDQIKSGDNISVGYMVQDNGVRVANYVGIPIPFFRGKVASVGNDGFVLADKTQSVPVAVTPETKITAHTYNATLADLMVGYSVTARGIPSGNAIRAINVGLSLPQIKGVVLSTSLNAMVVRTDRQKTVNVAFAPGTVVLVRPKNAPNFPGTPADVKPGTTVWVGGHKTGPIAMLALWVDLLVP